MRLTRIEKINFVKDAKSKIKAYVDAVFDGQLMICGLKLIEGDSGLFLAFPSRKTVFCCPNCGTSNLLGKRTRYCRNCLCVLNEYTKNLPAVPGYRDIAYSVDKRFFKYLENAFVKAYKKTEAAERKQDTPKARREAGGLSQRIFPANPKAPAADGGGGTKPCEKD